MLNNRNLEDKTYEQLITEALMEIPLHTKEWTNFNHSDPGVTILENLTAFGAVQLNRINQITPVINKKLLKMVGFEAARGRCSRILLSPEGLINSLELPANQKFVIGDMCFETNRAIDIGVYHITNVLSARRDKTIDCSYLLDREVKVPVSVFGEKPEDGNSIWFVMDNLPEPGEDILFYVTASGRYNRNPFDGKSGSAFADIKWECYTEEGFEALRVRDLSGSFLVSGEIRMRLPKTKAALCTHIPLGKQGYVIRATLQNANYDATPKLQAVSGFLFEAWQKYTCSACYTFNRLVSASLPGETVKDGYVMVYCKEKKGSSYKKYDVAYRAGLEGRYCDHIINPDGTHTWLFNKEKYGFGPEKLKNAIKILSYNEDVMRTYSLGTVLGMDNQEIKLPFNHIVADSFNIVAKRIDENGEEIYDFVRPNRDKEGDLFYRLYENDGKIIIEDAGDFIGANLYIGNLSLTQGEKGNIRGGNKLTGVGIDENISFYNPTAATGGCFAESLESVKKRFLKDLKTPYVAVTAADYEKLVAQTPQLCIHKVKAFMNPERNQVRIAVKPGTDEEFPKLPQLYKDMIMANLEDKRLITTKISIIPPAYVPVQVHGTIYVKRQYENARQQIEKVIREKVDFINSDKNFGDVLKFDEMFHAVEALDCVEYVYELSMHPQKPGLARLVESDIVPRENSLCYAGDIILDIVTYEK